MAGNKEAVFDYLDNNFTAVAFDEFTLTDELPSDLDSSDIDLSTNFSRHVGAHIPILTTPMTTITEERMAIEAAKAGGAGVIHHANTPQEQKDAVVNVKFHLNGLITNPIMAHRDETLGATLESLNNRRKDFRTLPVIDEDNRFVGLMTNTHFQLFKNDPEITIAEAMTPAEDIFTASSSMGDNPGEALRLMQERKIKLLPLLDDEHRIEGLYLLDGVQRSVEENPQNYNLDAAGRLITCMSVSTYDNDALERLELSGKYLDMVVIDTSHGESKYSFSTYRALQKARGLVKNIREEYGAIDIMVGNVSDGSPESAAVALAQEGADAIRVGRGPGGICISREKLGGGTPQATAIYTIAKAVRAIDPDIRVCADGGIRGPGDLLKALYLGASAVMLGSYVAGTDEAAAPVMERPDGTKYKEYNGMGSAKEQARSKAARRRYGVNVEDTEIFVEGIEKEYPLQGPVSRKFFELTRGAKIEMATGGFSNIETLQAEGNMSLVSNAGLQEGQARR